jgi:hypothetical protein
MEFNSLSVLDYTSALVVILCIAFKFQSNWIWFPYSLACSAYVYINIEYGIYGAAILNAIVGCIAIFHLYSGQNKMLKREIEEYRRSAYDSNTVSYNVFGNYFDDLQAFCNENLGENVVIDVLTSGTLSHYEHASESNAFIMKKDKCEYPILDAVKKKGKVIKAIEFGLVYVPCYWIPSDQFQDFVINVSKRYKKRKNFKALVVLRCLDRPFYNGQGSPLIGLMISFD